MEYQSFGRSGLKTSRLCFGAMLLSSNGRGPWRMPAVSDVAACEAMLDRYVKAGGNFIDTSNNYGESEAIIGNWLKKQSVHTRRKLIIATKFASPVDTIPANAAINYPNSSGSSRKHIMDAIQDSLQKLQIDYLDVYTIHFWDDATQLEDIIRTLQNLIQMGRIHYYAVSNYTPTQLQQLISLCKQHQWDLPLFTQCQYNLLCRTAEWELIRLCRSHGIGFLAWSPLAGGWLSNKYSEQNRTKMKKPPANSRMSFAELVHFSSWDLSTMTNNPNTWPVLQICSAISVELKCTVSQVAIRWILNQEITGCILGPRTFNHLDDTLAALKLKLTPKHMAMLNEASHTPPIYPYCAFSELTVKSSSTLPEINKNTVTSGSGSSLCDSPALQRLIDLSSSFKPTTNRAAWLTRTIDQKVYELAANIDPHHSAGLPSSNGLHDSSCTGEMLKLGLVFGGFSSYEEPVTTLRQHLLQSESNGTIRAFIYDALDLVDQLILYVKKELNVNWMDSNLNLFEWIRFGAYGHQSNDRPNATIFPSLFLINQFVILMRFLELSNLTLAQLKHHCVFSSGFSLGIVAAYVVDISINEEQLRHNALAAIRLFFWFGFRAVQVFEKLKLAQYSKQIDKIGSKLLLSHEVEEWTQMNDITSSIQIVGVPHKDVMNAIDKFNNTNQFNCKFDVCVVSQADCVTIFGFPHYVPQLIQYLQSNFPSCLLVSVPLDIPTHTPRYYSDTVELVLADFCNGQPQFDGISSRNKWNQTAFISNCDGKPIVGMTCTELVKSILLKVCRWDLVSDSLAQIIQSSETYNTFAPILLLDLGPGTRSKNLINNNPLIQERLMKKQIVLFTMNHLPHSLLAAAQRVNESIPNERILIRNNISNHMDHVKNSIAIVGMACRFPDANNPDEYFYNLLHKKRSIRPIPKERWDHSKYYDPDPTSFYKTKAQHMAAIDEIDLFDPQFFNLSIRDANRMDPQQRLTLEMCYLALENAGYVIGEGARTGLDEQRVGVFVGCTGLDGYGKNADAHMDALLVQCRPRSMQAGRVSYFFKFCGPSVQVDTACSTSLICLHLAVESILRGECDAAVVCAALVCVDPMEFIALAGSGFLSTGSNGGCRAFSVDADGYTRSDGVAAIIIKPYKTALRDRDCVHALINSTAMNQSGQTQNLLLPSQSQIESLIHTALVKAHIPPGAINYVEAHGTGTQGGDPLEMNAIIKTLGMDLYRSDKNPLYVGTHKAFIGHCEATAGLAGVIKTVMMLQHKTITPHIQIDKINPKIEMQPHVIIPQQPQSWTVPHCNMPRRAIVNSFGFSGANGICVLQESPTLIDESDDKSIESVHLITISGKQSDSVKAYCLRFIQYLVAIEHKLNSISSNSNGSGAINELRFLRDLAYTTTARRNHFVHRIAIVTASVKELIQKLTVVVTSIPGQLERLQKEIGSQSIELLTPINQNLFLSKELQNSVTNTTNLVASAATRIVFMFGGQGSQYYDMCHQLLNSDNIWASTFRHCSDLFAAIHPTLLPNNMTLVEILEAVYKHESCQTNNSTIRSVLEERTFNSTLVSQPLLFAVEYSLAKMLISWGIYPSYIIGHSLGELVGACVSSVISLEDATFLIGHRARLMRNTSDGSMLAINCTIDDFTSLCRTLHLNENNRTEVSVAVNNSTQSIIIGGETTAIDTLQSYIVTNKLFHAKKLKVTHAFHTHFMSPILSEFRSIADKIFYKPGKIPIFSTLNGKLSTTFNSEYWTEQLHQTVQFHAATSALHALALKENFKPICIELNPTPVLTQYMSEPGKDFQTYYILHKNRNEFQQIYSVIADLYVHQWAPICWSEVHRTKRHARVLSLPNYVFNQKSCWLKIPWVTETIAEEYTMDSQNAAISTSNNHRLLCNSSNEIIQDLPLIGKCYITENEAKNTFDCRFPVFDRIWRVDIQNHIVASKPLFPVALYTALISQFASFIIEHKGIKLGLNTFTIVKDLMIKTAFFWDDKDSKPETCREMIISLIYSRNDSSSTATCNCFSFTVASKQYADKNNDASSKPVVHAFGNICLTDTYSNDIDADKDSFDRIAHAIINGSQNKLALLSYDRNEFYRRSNEIGITYGPHYQFIDKFMISDDTLTSWAMQTMNVNQPYTDLSGNTLIHPSWLDSFMQAGAVQFSHIPNLNRPLIAMFIENLFCRTHIYNSPTSSTLRQDGCESHAIQSNFATYYTESRAIVNSVNQITFEMRGFDENGRCVVHLNGGIMKAANTKFNDDYQSGKAPKQSYQLNLMNENVFGTSNELYNISVSPDQSQALIRKIIVETLSDFLNVDPITLDHKENFTNMGIDSLILNDLQEKLQNTLVDITLRPTTMFDYPSVNSLVDFIISQKKRAWMSLGKQTEDGKAMNQSSSSPISIDNIRLSQTDKNTVDTNINNSHDPNSTSFHDEVRNQLIALIAESLETEACLIKNDDQFTQIGVDSLMSIEIRGKIQTSFGLNLPASLIFDYPTMKELTEFIQKELVSQKGVSQTEQD